MKMTLPPRQSAHSFIRRSARHSKGFSLVEILTAVAIIGILASLIVAGTGGARKKAQAAAVQNQMRQIFAATALFAADHDNRLPKVAATGISGDPSEFFFLMKGESIADLEKSGLNPYLGDSSKVWLAPGDDGRKADGTPGRNFSYSFNFLINKGELQEGATGPSGFEKALGTIRPQLLDNPSRKILFFEEDRPNDGFCVWFIDQPTRRHGGKAHVGFADGHVELLPSGQIFGNGELCELLPPGSQY